MIWSPLRSTYSQETLLLLTVIMPVMMACSQYSGGQALNSLTKVARSSLPIHLPLVKVRQTWGQGCTNRKGQMRRQTGVCSSGGFSINYISDSCFAGEECIILLVYQQMKSYLSSTPQPKLASPVRDSQDTEIELPLSPEIKSIIRRKVSSYLNCHVTLTPPPSKQLLPTKKNKPLPKQFPEYANLAEFLKEERSAFHLYKEKIDRGLDECLYFYLRLLCLAIDYECRVSEREIDEQSSVAVQAFLFVSSSLLEAGAEKAGYYFATIAITFCEYYKTLHPIGEFLLIMAKINRKLFKYRESIVLLKKALEYNWWVDVRRADKINGDFKRWLARNSSDDLQTYEEKYEVGRVFPPDQHLSHRSHRADGELKYFRDLLHSFVESSKMAHEGYDVTYRKARAVSQRAVDLQLQIYNEMSFNFLQLNQKQQSKIFAEKYESGYTEPEDSKIVLLSRQLINSIQKRVTGWHLMTLKNFELLFFVDIFSIVSRGRARMRVLDQEVVLDSFKVIFESLCQNFVQKQMFSYQIPLPLQLRREVAKSRKRSDGKKFIIRQRSSSHTNKQNVQVLKKYSSDKVEENLIFNYRGLRVSRLKLLDIYGRFMERVAEVEHQGSFRGISWH